MKIEYLFKNTKKGVDIFGQSDVKAYILNYSESRVTKFHIGLVYVELLGWHILKSG